MQGDRRGGCFSRRVSASQAVNQACVFFVEALTHCHSPNPLSPQVTGIPAGVGAGEVMRLLTGPGSITVQRLDLTVGGDGTQVCFGAGSRNNPHTGPPLQLGSCNV